MQHLVEQHHVEAVARRAIGKWQPIGIAQPHLRVLDARLQQPVAGDGQHVRADVHAHGALGVGRDQFQHPAGAGAGVQEILDSIAGQAFGDCRLDILFRGMKRADALPLRRIGLEIGRRRRRALLAHMLQPGMVGFLGAGIGQGGDGRAQFGAGAAVGGAAEHPASFLEALHQPGLTQELEVPGDAGLALPHDLDQLADRQFGLAQQQQQAQPGGVAGGTQHGNQPVQSLSSHISISLYALFACGCKGAGRAPPEPGKRPAKPGY